eukprot:3747187-Prymnesium_polylepis.1
MYKVSTADPGDCTPRGRAPVMRYRVTWCSLSSPVACYAKMGVRMYGQPSCICLLARRGSTPSAERYGTPS